jgi:rhomboid protease GluP
MDIQHFLAMNIMVVSALVLFVALLDRNARGDWWWLGINVCTIAVAAVATQWLPQHAGTLSAIVFVPFVLAPLLLGRLLQRRVAQRRMREAARLARLLAWLNPTSATRFNAAMLEAQSGATLTEQRAGLEALAASIGAAERPMVEIARLRLEARWEDVLALIEQQPEGSRSMAVLQIRALGETGRPDRMARAYDDAKPYLNGGALWEAQLVLLALAGRYQATERLLAGPLASLDQDAKRYWMAVAAKAAGADPSAWRPELARLADAAEAPSTRLAAQRVLASTKQAPTRLDDVASAIVGEVEHRVMRLASAAVDGRSRRAPVTWLLLAGIIAGYVLSETRGGSSDLRTLVELGALWPPYVMRRDEWWRLATTLFLHFGLLHAAVNGFMLLVLGRLCEMVLGSLRMAVVYVVGGLASSGFVLWLAVSGLTEQTVLVGASGAIMALFGALAGRSLVVWLRYRDTLDGRNLMSLVFIAGLQVAVDLMTPQVSLAAHASGLVTGLMIGAAMTLARERQR